MCVRACVRACERACVWWVRHVRHMRVHACVCECMRVCLFVGAVSQCMFNGRY